MFELLKQNNPLALGFVSLLSACLAGAVLIAQASYLEWGLHSLWLALSMLALLGLGIYLNSVLSKYRLLGERNYLPVLIYFMLAAPYLNQPIHWKYILASFFLFFGIQRSLALAEESRVNRLVLDASLSFGLASLFVPGSLAALLIIPIALLNFQHLSLRHILLILIGSGLPWFFLWETYFLLDLDRSSLFALELRKDVDLGMANWGMYTLALLFSLAVPKMLSTLNRTKLKIRQSVLLSIWASFFALVLNSILFGFSSINWVLFVPALSILITNQVLESRKAWQGNVLILFCLLVAVYNLLFLPHS
jgi:hypothetical protein